MVRNYAIKMPKVKSIVLMLNGVPYGIRTRVAAVRGRRPRPLDEGDRSYRLCTHAEPKLRKKKRDQPMAGNPIAH